ncbi:MAG TPA: diguanylate cyclase [Porticoccaceae bacterium]|nr:diguanylate cyclase [Porticoccaceae bacterium]HCO60769.1 diguanylate cyclase [Porticoccaceae bacterium]
MELKQIQVNVADLTLGMYVSRLDRPWKNTPFPLQGFHIRASEDIATLKTYCDFVYIDVTKGKGVLGSNGTAAPNRDRRARIRQNSVDRRKLTRDVPFADDGCPPINVRRGVYEVTTSLKAEAAHAQRLVRDLRANLNVVTRQIARGNVEDYENLKSNVSGMVESVLRCPDAFTWLVRLRDKDQHTHDHSLRSALWAVQFARYIGMDKSEISVLCMGTLLKDIGKVKIPNALLRKQDRSEEEEQEYQKYVEYGVEMLRSTRKVEPRVISVVRYHAERHNGQGYPERISGTKIPLLARIAGIATVYDSICNPREARQPLSPSRAVSVLYNMRGEAFQEDLVVQFIQSVGLYPTGTLVELSTGDIGVVVEQHPNSRLTPQVAVLGRSVDNLNENVFLIDLKDDEATRSLLEKNSNVDLGTVDRVAIARDLEPLGYEVDMANISSLFLLEGMDDGKGGLWQMLKEKLRPNS